MQKRSRSRLPRRPGALDDNACDFGGDANIITFARALIVRHLTFHLTSTAKFSVCVCRRKKTDTGLASKRIYFMELCEKLKCALGSLQTEACAYNELRAGAVNGRS